MYRVMADPKPAKVVKKPATIPPKLAIKYAQNPSSNDTTLGEV